MTVILVLVFSDQLNIKKYKTLCYLFNETYL